MITHLNKTFKNWGIRPLRPEDAKTLGVQLTLCQFIVILLALSSGAFLLFPLFFLKSWFFILLCWSVGIVFMFTGIYVWIHQQSICEHPEHLREVIEKEEDLKEQVAEVIDSQ